MMRADGIKNIEAAQRLLTIALSAFQEATEMDVPSTSDVSFETISGIVTLKRDGTVILVPNQELPKIERKAATDRVMRKGISYWGEPAGDVCRCCKGSGRG